MEEPDCRLLVELLCGISRASSSTLLQSMVLVVAVCGLAFWTRFANVLHQLPERSPRKIHRAGHRATEDFQLQGPPLLQGALRHRGAALFLESPMRGEARRSEQLRPSIAPPLIEQEIALFRPVVCQAGRHSRRTC